MKKRLPIALKMALEESGLWRKDAVLLAGVSGGPDSVALLWGLCQVRQEMPFRLICCHVQHQLRGQASRDDQLFVETLCQNWQVECQRKDAGLCGDMHTPGMETMAREKRRQLFACWMEETSADGLLLAHHRDDQTETVLMHLLRGSGLKGLGGMANVQPYHNGLLLRPLLGFRKEELLALLSQEGIPFRRDASNEEALTPRNALRLNILPSLETLYPGAGRHMAAAAESLRQDERCLDGLAEELYRSACPEGNDLPALLLAPLTHAPAAVLVRVLRRFYRNTAALLPIAPEERELSHRDSQRLLSLLQEAPGQTANLPNQMEMYRGQTLLVLQRQGGDPLTSAEEETEVPLAKGELFFGGYRFLMEASPADYAPSALSVLLSPEEAAQAVLRHPLPGDHFHPMGAAGKKPLRRWLTDKKIDLPLRRHIPLLSIGQEVLWIPGLTCAERLRRSKPDGLIRLVLQEPQKCLYLLKE